MHDSRPNNYFEPNNPRFFRVLFVILGVFTLTALAMLVLSL